MNKPLQIAILGGRSADENLLNEAEKAGRLIAERGAILICGGMSGIMEAACKGAQAAGGITVGILPTAIAEEGNPYLTIPIPTGMGSARNVLILRSCHAAIAIDGKHGTLSEIGYALDLNKPIAGIRTWDIPGVHHVKSAGEAVKWIFKKLEKGYE